MKKGINWRVLIVSLILVYGVGYLGSLFVGGGVDSGWYDSIRPSIAPPDWTFSVVWSILFFLIALSLYFAWVNSKKGEKRIVCWVFGGNLVLNASWSYLFFGLQSPLLAFIDLIFIFVSIIVMMFVAGRLDRRAGWLLVPYLGWVGFAGVLNYLILMN